MQDNFYVKDFRHYQLLGWQHYLGTTAFLVLKELWAMEQTTNYHINKNAFSESRVFSISDKQLMDLLGINSKNTVKQAILKLERYNLIEILSDRSKNHIGFATEYLITKPIPIPKNIRIPHTLNGLIGKIRCQQIIDELIQLNQVEAKSDPFTVENYEENSKKSETSNSQKLPPNKETRPKTQTESEGDISIKDKDLKIKNTVEMLSKVEEFKKFNIENTLFELLEIFPIDALDKVANYFLKNNPKNIKSLYAYLRFACENPDKFQIQNTGLEESDVLEDEFLKNSIQKQTEEKEYEHDAEGFNFLD